MNPDELLEEINEIKKEIKETREEAKAAREEASQTRDLLDSNVMAVYRKMAKKTASTLLIYSSFLGCIAMILAICLKEYNLIILSHISEGIVIFSMISILIGISSLIIAIIEDIRVTKRNKEHNKKVKTYDL